MRHILTEEEKIAKFGSIEKYNQWRERKTKRAKEYRYENLNSKGQRLSHIRRASSQYLFRSLKHEKLDDYEIHHCFGYDDHKKFIYIPKKLHDQIHSILRKNFIKGTQEHWNMIRDLVNSCTEYTYISC